MPADKPNRKSAARKRRLADAVESLTALQFGPKQRNETAAYTLLALLDLQPDAPWTEAQAPLRGITPIIDFIAEAYDKRFAPNTRETIRDDAVKFFVEEGLLLRNPDDPNRPTNSGKTVYQIEPTALALFRKVGTLDWSPALKEYLTSRESLKHEIARKRDLARVPVTLPDGSKVALSPGGQNPLIKAIIEQFCPAFAPGGVVLYIGDTENKFVHLEAAGLTALGVTLDSAAKIPDVIVHDTKRNWLLLIEAVTSAGPVDGKRRKELKDLFVGCKAGLVFVTAFETRRTMQTFVSHIAWESEVWIAEDPDHMIHFNGERFLGPYADVSPKLPVLEIADGSPQNDRAVGKEAVSAREQMKEWMKNVGSLKVYAEASVPISRPLGNGSLAAKTVSFLKKQLGHSQNLENILTRITMALARSPDGCIRLSEAMAVDARMGLQEVTEREVIAVLSLMTHPDVKFFRMEFHDRGADSIGSLTPEEITKRLTKWWRTKEISDEEWKNWASFVEVCWVKEETK